MNIENGVVAGELSDAALENMREKYKELKKQSDAEDMLQRGRAKGAAIAEKTMQSVFGLSKAFEGPGGLLGSIKGFGKGLKDTLKTSNIMMSMFKKMFEQAVAADKAREKLFQKAQLTDFTLEFMEISTELSKAYGVGAAGSAVDVIADLQAEMKIFKEFRDSDELKSIAVMSGKLKRFNVSTTAMGSIFQGMTKGIGFKL